MFNKEWYPLAYRDMVDRKNVHVPQGSSSIQWEINLESVHPAAYHQQRRPDNTLFQLSYIMKLYGFYRLPETASKCMKIGTNGSNQPTVESKDFCDFLCVYD